MYNTATGVRSRLYKCIGAGCGSDAGHRVGLCSSIPGQLICNYRDICKQVI